MGLIGLALLILSLVKALLWVPVIIFVGLIVLPFVDRGKYMSPGGGSYS